MRKDKETFEQVKDLYINERLSPEKIAMSINVSSKQIYRWVDKFEWGKERERLIEEENYAKQKASCIYRLEDLISDLKYFIDIIKTKIEEGTRKDKASDLIRAANEIMNTLGEYQSLKRMEDEAEERKLKVMEGGKSNV